MVYAIAVVPVRLIALGMRAMLVVAASTDRQAERQDARRKRGWQP
jgi:hypothetical protein